VVSFTEVSAPKPFMHNSFLSIASKEQDPRQKLFLM